MLYYSKAVQHERAPRGALKRSYPLDAFIPTTAAAAVATVAPFLSTSLPSTSSPSISVGQHIYSSGSFTFPWRPALGSVHSLHHAHVMPMPRLFPYSMIPPSSSSLRSETIQTASPSNNMDSQTLKEDEVSSSAKEETLMSEKRNNGTY